MYLSSMIFIAVGLSVAMALAWIVAGRSGQSGWIDVFWSFSVGIAGAGAALTPFGKDVTARQLLVTVLIALWSLRLGLHIARRSLRGGDDPRYQQLRSEWGDGFRRRLFWFLQIQAAAAFLLAMSVMIAAHRPQQMPGLAGLDLCDFIGAAIVLIALAGESVSDRQLAAFGHDPANKGRVCDVGLWRQSRHPNYFFEWLGWLGYAVISVDLGGVYFWGWIAVIGPIFMYWLLVHVSGIPPLEAHMVRSRGEAYRHYQRQVNAFWPGPARSS